ncbi:MAG TPA: MarR family transcriptional regulator [Candidatus Thermoplasmatota archaeon]|nr:MarR family transcriptional regulator [Candidatus Thermoplasmatota archaeon]
MTVVLATVGFHPEKVLPALRSHEDKEALVLFHDTDADGKSKRAARAAREDARRLGLEAELVAVDAFDLVATCLRLRREIRKRSAARREVVVSIAGGTRVLQAAALLAGVLEGVRVTHVNERTNVAQSLPLLRLSAAEILSPKRRRVLLFVRDRPGCQARDIAQGLSLAKGTVSHHVRELRRRGLVEGEPDPDDSRSERLRAVPSAELLLAE